MKEFDAVQQAFYEHHTLECTAHEAVLRRDELRTQLFQNTVGRNRNAAIAAITHLNARISPAKSAEQLHNEAIATIVSQAQRLRDGGDDRSAQRILKSAKLTLDDLTDRSPNLVLEQREEAAYSEYSASRTQSIGRLQADLGLTLQAATAVFEGREANPIPRSHPDAPEPRRFNVSMDAELRKQVNRKNAFEPDRQMVEPRGEM